MKIKIVKIIKLVGILFLIFFIQGAIFVIINLPLFRYYEDQEIEDFKTSMINFSLTHQNIKSGLFINPDISSNYYAVNSINFTIADELSSDLINPNDNYYLQEDQIEFYLDYLIEKQNEDGSFSDIIGLGDIKSTYQAISIIDQIDGTFLNKYPQRIEKLFKFLNNTMERHGWGFKSRNSSQEADIISTYYGIKIAKRFGFSEINKNYNLTNFIESTFTGVGYQYTTTIPLMSPETTYFGIKAYLALDNFYLPFDLNSIYNYISALFNSSDGSYSEFPDKNGDIRSTYFALGCLDLLEFNPHDKKVTYEYIIKCSSSNGGFVSNPNISDSTASDFVSSWAAINSYDLLSLNDNQKEEFRTYISNYYNWLSDHQAKNGLFGNITIEVNYFGVLSVHLTLSDGFSQIINVSNLISFIHGCYNIDGGYGSRSNEISTIYNTFLAINLYRIINNHQNIVIPNSTETKEFLGSQQNEDGGFRLGNSSTQIYSFFGPYSIFLDGMLEEDTSIMQNSYWAIDCLDYFNALDYFNTGDLIQWVLACQNADGGFSFKVGFISDIISTYYGLKLLRLLKINPSSILAAIKFIQNTQTPMGSFDLNPLFSDNFDTPPSFLVTFFAAKSLYDNKYQAEDIIHLRNWYEACLDTKTGGVGDSDYFGANLRNTPYGIILINEMKFDRSFNPIPFNRFLIYLIIIEVAIIVVFIILKLVRAFFMSLSRELNLSLFKREKLNISYLKNIPAIVCENLSVYVGRKLIIDSISIEVQHGEILGVLGESGSGKSTFVKSLLGMRKYKGVSEIYGMDSRKNAKKFRPLYGYIPQDLSKMYHNVTVLQNLQYFGQQYGLTEEEINIKAEKILKALGIDEKIDSLVKTLSGGQKRRVSIALGLIHTPIVCILDEPTSGLDPVVRENLWLALTKINEKFGTTLIVITHYPEESRFCNQVAIFGRNRGIIDYGKPAELLSQLPGDGRTIELSFKTFQKKATQRLENIDGIERVLENKTGTDFSLYSDLNLEKIRSNIENEFGSDTIIRIGQTEARMEQYFRYKAMVIPNE